MSVVTRFAPSPTGDLHLGGARTALFNWLYARHYGGQFLLRIEDTDQARSQPIFEQNIQQSLEWMGLHWDGAIQYQSKRQQRHQDMAFSLLQTNRAYRCYMTHQEREDLRSLAPEQALVQSKMWRHRSDYPQNQPFAIRLKVPLSGHTTIKDGLQGTVTVPNNTLDDIVLLRQDGTATYMLAVVVDDHDMNVSHIIRGDDHLTNAIRQHQIYTALDWAIPSLYHVPLILNEAGDKLSKRKGDLSVLDYRRKGILPEALCNALVRLGWSHGNEEKITLDQAVSWFNGKNLSKSASRFDDQKVLSLNAHYMRQMDTDLLWETLLEDTQRKDLFNLDFADKAKTVLKALAQRTQDLVSLAQMAKDYTHPEITLSQTLKDTQKEILGQSFGVLEDLKGWQMQEIENALREHCQNQGIAFKDLALPLRIALTGQKVSPSLTEVMVALGQTWTLKRLRHAIDTPSVTTTSQPL
jgi:glutamyl-tRNA synthetase